MNLLPYESFCEVRLGESQDDVVLSFGEPIRRQQNRSGELEFQYEAMVVRFGTQGVVEITARPETVVLEGAKISRHALASYLQTRDPYAKLIHGFVVSLKFGVAVDDDSENDGWISVFVRGHWNDVIHLS